MGSSIDREKVIKELSELHGSKETMEIIEQAIALLKDKQPEHQILFLKSWNEWGEGNYVEPDLKFGHGYLQAIRQAIESSKE